MKNPDKHSVYRVFVEFDAFLSEKGLTALFPKDEKFTHQHSASG